MRISDWSSDVCSSDLADPRLSPAQAIVDAAMKTAADRGESARMVATIRESTRQLVAARIKAGGSLDGEIGRAAQVQAPAPRDKDPSRSRLHLAKGISPPQAVNAGPFCDCVLSHHRPPPPPP